MGPAARALAALVLLGAAAITSQEKLSSHSCAPEGGAGEKHQTCTFKNLVIQDGQAYYLARGEVEVPRVRVDFKVAESSPSQFFEVAVVAPEALPPAAAEERRGDAYLWAGCFDSNYAHCMGETVVSLGNTVCEWMGRCSYGSRKGLTVLSLSTDERQRHSNSTPPFLRDALACVADRPMLHVAAPELAGTRLLLARALVGVGPTSRTRFRDGRKPMPAASMLAWRRRLGQCLGFDDATPAATGRPRVMVVARPYSAGRALLNQEEVVAAVRQRYGGSADVVVRYMEGLSLAQQAALWSRQSIVVHVHGSVLGSWQFLPPGAVVLQLSALPVFHEHAGAFGNALAVDLAGVSPNITWKHLANWDWAYSHALTEELWAEGAWSEGLSLEAERALLRRGDCSAVPADKAGACTFALHHSFNVVIRPDQLLYIFDRAWRELYAKQGLPPLEPRGLPAAEAYAPEGRQQEGACGGPAGAPAGLRALVTGERVLLAGLLVAWAAMQLRRRRRR